MTYGKVAGLGNAEFRPPTMGHIVKFNNCTVRGTIPSTYLLYVTLHNYYPKHNALSGTMLPGRAPREPNLRFLIKGPEFGIPARWRILEFLSRLKLIKLKHQVTRLARKWRLCAFALRKRSSEIGVSLFLADFFFSARKCRSVADDSHP